MWLRAGTGLYSCLLFSCWIAVRHCTPPSPTHTHTHTHRERERERERERDHYTQIQNRLADTFLHKYGNVWWREGGRETERERERGGRWRLRLMRTLSEFRENRHQMVIGWTINKTTKLNANIFYSSWFFLPLNPTPAPPPLSLSLSVWSHAHFGQLLGEMNFP